MRKSKPSKQVRQEQRASYSRKLDMINPDTAFIDIGSAEHWVCIPEDREPENVRQFTAFTSQLYAIRDWLLKHEIQTVGMESTGVYWIPLYQVLSDAGFEVYLVNARDVKSVKGRPKTDRLDCQWGQTLLTYGLLRNSFRPASEICEMRSIWRSRDHWIKEASRCIQRMQKALHEMNLLLPKVVSDITGKTGLSIIKAILAGEHDPIKLAKLRDPRVRKSEEQIAEALRGDYRPEQLFLLGKELDHYEYILKQLADFDHYVEERIGQLPKILELDPGTKSTNRKEHERYKRRCPKAPSFDSRSTVHELTGVDIGALPGLSHSLMLGIILEVGLDMSKWPTEHHFTSWLALCPNLRRSAGKDLGTHTKKSSNRAAGCFRQGASTLRNNHTYLGDFYRRMRSRGGEAYAITATARKLAALFYILISKGEQFVPIDRTAYEQAVKEIRVANLEKRARQLGYSLQPNDQSTEESPPAIKKEKPAA